MIQSIGLAVNLDKPNATEIASALTESITARGRRVFVDEAAAAAIGRPDLGLSLDAFPGRVDVVFILGGDGTLLGYARRFARHGLPLLGFNLGHLGFLSEAEPGDLDQAVHRVLEGNFDLEQRMMLEAEVRRQGRLVDRLLALNDFAVGKGSLGRMATLRVDVDGMYVDRFAGDGLIVSTPTGSTAYSLSCGGPIVVPHLEVVILTPICPHTLSARPMIVAADRPIRILALANHSDLGLSADGQVHLRLQPGDEIVVQKSPYYTTLVQWRERRFFDVLRQKLRGAEDR
ncbi:MAG: NAD(+)/NADH kinase [Alicyclobacillaceae bacterium]|nr:NAD(+)/NADH kinase [Alicyclobacillaceae bacterium]